MADVESVEESCLCGATFKSSGWAPNLDRRLIEWRTNHHHQEVTKVVRQGPYPYNPQDPPTTANPS